MHFTRDCGLSLICAIAFGGLRTYAETCAAFQNMDLTALYNSKLSIAIPDIFGNENTCLCTSQVSDFIQRRDTPSTFAASLTTDATVEDALTHIIEDISAYPTCDYPAHSIPFCTPADVCGFKCTDGYTRLGSTCTCRSLVCPSGDCAASCPPGTPSKRSPPFGMDSGPCPIGWDICGGYSGRYSFECINTRSALDSCGGCVHPLNGKHSAGKDCSIIPGVNSVRCRAGKCDVKSCMRGWKVSKDKQSCVWSYRH